MRVMYRIGRELHFAIAERQSLRPVCSVFADPAHRHENAIYMPLSYVLHSGRARSDLHLHILKKGKNQR